MRQLREMKIFLNLKVKDEQMQFRIFYKNKSIEDKDTQFNLFL